MAKSTGTPPPSAAKSTTAAKEIKLTTKSDKVIAAKSFNWSVSPDPDAVIHKFLKGKAVVGFPVELVDSYRNAGLIAEAVKDEDDE